MFLNTSLKLFHMLYLINTFLLKWWILWRIGNIFFYINIKSNLIYILYFAQLQDFFGFAFMGALVIVFLFAVGYIWSKICHYLSLFCSKFCICNYIFCKLVSMITIFFLFLYFSFSRFYIFSSNYTFILIWYL